MKNIDLNTYNKPKPVPKLDESLPWVDTKKYSYKELQIIDDCQRCGTQLSRKGDKWINSDRRTCETCWRARD